MTTDCKECKHFMEIMGVKTCGKQKEILKNEVVGCYGGDRKPIKVVNDDIEVIDNKDGTFTIRGLRSYMPVLEEHCNIDKDIINSGIYVGVDSYSDIK